MLHGARHVLFAVLIVATVPASAQTNIDAAREAAERGRREYNLGRWQQAIEGFEKAYQLTGDAALLFNLAQAHRQLGHTVDALRLYRTFLREKPDAPNRAVAEKQIKELESGQPATAPPPLPPPAVLTPGPASPAAPGPATPALGAGAATAPPAASPPASAPSPATVAPPLAAPPPAGGPPPAAGAPASTVSVVAAPPPPSPAPRTPLPKWIPIAGAGATVIAVTGAILTGLSASTRFADLYATCGQTAAGCTSAEIDVVKSRDRTATILWVAAGLLAAATGVSIYVNTREAGASALWRF